MSSAGLPANDSFEVERAGTPPRSLTNPAFDPTQEAMMTSAGPTREIRRDDDELVGLLVCEGDAWRPTTLFGASLAEPTDAAHAESIVRERGLASLAERWLATIDGETVDVWLLEVRSDRVRLRLTDPMWMQGGHGEWHEVADLALRLR